MTDTPSVGTTKAEVRRARRAVVKARLIQILWGTDLLATRVVVGVPGMPVTKDIPELEPCISMCEECSMRDFIFEYFLL